MAFKLKIKEVKINVEMIQISIYCNKQHIIMWFLQLYSNILYYIISSAPKVEQYGLTYHIWWIGGQHDLPIIVVIYLFFVPDSY